MRSTHTFYRFMPTARVIVFILLLWSGVCTGFSQVNRKIVVMNMDQINTETNGSRFLSTIRLMRMTGVDFDTTSSLDTAFTYPVVITGTRVVDGKLSVTQQNQFKNYVNQGGVLITSNMRDTALFAMCGIAASSSSSILCEMVFDTTFLPEIYHDVDDSLEVDISLGDTAVPTSFSTRYYTLNGGTYMAKYENNKGALVYHAYGNGHVFTFGPDLRDLVLRNQIDFDANAQRVYSNGFEPTTDVISFVVRNIVRKFIPNSVYKYTVPGSAGSVFIMTHDIDSDSGMDTMHLFSDFEASRNIPAIYNVTTRYFNDGWMTSFYVGSWSEVHALLAGGHTLSSHSVGHFPDFDNETNFPLGTTGNTPPLYQPFYTSGSTTGGTVMGEVEVSKNLIEDDHSVKVRSFRAGHLCYNDSLALGLMQMNYEFNSTHSANNVLTSFPFYDLKVRSFSSTESSILEIPMTISDVFSTNPISSTNYVQKVNTWKRVCRKYHANHSPVVLLIHPNRTWKVTAEQMIVDSLPQGMEFYAFEKFGEFWRKRDSLDYHTQIAGDTLFLYADNDKLAFEQSFVIDMNGLDTARFFDFSGTELFFNWLPLTHGRRLYYQVEDQSSITQYNTPEFDFSVFPNPASSVITLVSEKELPLGSISLIDINGKRIMQQTWRHGRAMQIDLSHILSESGMYLLQYSSPGISVVKRLVFYAYH